MEVIAQFRINERLVNIIKNKTPYFGGYYSVEVMFIGDKEPSFEKKGFCLDAAHDFAATLTKQININEINIQKLIN